MGSNTVKLIIAEVHVVLGVAAVSVLLATGHLDASVGAGFLGGLLGIGVAPPLVAYTPDSPPQGAQAAGAVQRPTGAASGPPGGSQAPLLPAQTQEQITGTGTGSAMPTGT